jgi:pantothenate synthetase
MSKKINVGEVLEEEINALRELMQLAVSKQDESVAASDRNNLLNTISHASATLGQLLKIQNEMDKGEGGSAEMLRQALQELEEEWPEFKQLVAKYYPDQKENKEG